MDRPHRSVTVEVLTHAPFDPTAHCGHTRPVFGAVARATAAAGEPTRPTATAEAGPGDITPLRIDLSGDALADDRDQERDDPDGGGAGHRTRIHPASERKGGRGRAERQRSGGRRRDRCRGEVGHAGHHRHPFASRRVFGPGHRIAAGRQRNDQPGHRGSVGRSLDLAAGSAVRAGARRRGDVDADPAGIRQPHRRARCHGEERAVADGRGDEVPGRASGFEDGLRRESAARLRATESAAVDADGEHRGVPADVAVRGRLSRQVEEVARRRIRSGKASGPQPPDGDARRRPGRRHPRPQPLLSRRRDGDDDPDVEGVRVQDRVVPSRGRGVQGARPAGAEQYLREHLGRLVGLQARGVRRDQGEHGARRTTRRAVSSSIQTIPTGSSG